MILCPPARNADPVGAEMILSDHLARVVQLENHLSFASLSLGDDGGFSSKIPPEIWVNAKLLALFLARKFKILQI